MATEEELCRVKVKLAFAIQNLRKISDPALMVQQLKLSNPDSNIDYRMANSVTGIRQYADTIANFIENEMTDDFIDEITGAG